MGVRLGTRGGDKAHRAQMVSLILAKPLGGGLFTFLPTRLMNELVFGGDHGRGSRLRLLGMGGAMHGVVDAAGVARVSLFIRQRHIFFGAKTRKKDCISSQRLWAHAHS